MTPVSVPTMEISEADEDREEAVAILDEQARLAGEIWERRFPGGRDW